MAFWKNLEVGVIGAGKSGLAATRLLSRLGARTLLSDGKKISASLPKGVTKEEGHSKKLLEKALLIRSPGVPNHLPVLRQALARKIPVWSELELASRLVQPKLLVAITGTNGKTTTTTLVGDLFKASHHPTFVGGNIGTPLSDLVPRITKKSAVVLEVSSYQLENIETFHPNISVLLNITPDHLEHHGSMKAYAAAKARIFENQTGKDVCVLNYDDPTCRKMAKGCKAQVFYFSRRASLKKGVYYNHGDVVLRWKGEEQRWKLQWDLPGAHNVENALAAIAVGVAGGLSASSIQKVFKRFRGVEHRLEFVRSLKGVRYVNDSKGTNVDSTRVALDSFKEPLLVIMGGEGKGAPYAPLKKRIRSGVRYLLLIGEDAPRIRRELGQLTPTETLGTMERAVRRARVLGRPGDVVLLSPACASFDQYNNYEERGRHFKSLVRRLR